MSVKPVFLDYNSTTPVHPLVIDAMQPYWRDQFGNASSRHQSGQTAWRALEQARVSISNLTQSHPDDVIFTSGATESNFLALQGRVEYLIESGRKPESIRIAVSGIEHPCVISCARRLNELVPQVYVVPVDSQCRVDPAFFDEHDAFDIVSIMTVNHETGVIQPIHETAKRAKAKNPNAFVHTDAAQWAGRIAFDFPNDLISSISLSAHKMYGPKGIGALVLRQENHIAPLMKGSQEAGYRAGSVNVPGVVGFGKAAEIMLKEREYENSRTADLREHLWRSLSDLGIGVIRTVDPQNTLPQTLHVRFVGMKGERVTDALDRLGLCCSPGPACASGASEASPVLLAMGLSEKQAWEGVRFSLGMCTTSVDIEEAGEICKEYASRVHF
jgi:cysteine desulfurase